MKYIAILNGKKYEVEVEKVETSYKPMSRGGSAAPVAAPVATPAPAPTPVAAPAPVASPAPVAAGDNSILSPMPGSIFDIKVSVGDVVKDGQLLLILEAMKMENEIYTHCDGVVASVDVKKGDVVDTDQVLITLK